MAQLPEYLASRYRVANSREIRSWSFGLVRLPRSIGELGWQAQRGTLDDQQIFGPRNDLECACGKYIGIKHRGMICDRCGVKVTSPAVRRERFGHVEFQSTMFHPLGQATDMLDAFPVIPTVYVHSIAGSRLAECYESLIETPKNRAPIQQTLERLVILLLPLVICAHEWRLVEAPRLAQGLALVQRESEMDEIF